MTVDPRLFIALPLDEPARLAVEGIVETVRAGEPEGRGVRWVRLEGLHLTLRFLGPTPEDRVPGLVSAIGAAAATAGPFLIRIAGSGSFPPTGRPRTLWLGVEDGAEGVARLAGALDDALAAAGWERSGRPFRAHLTLARADGVQAGPATVRALARAVEGVEIPATLDRMTLFESITGGGRARYRGRAEVRLT
ncbi:MAG TPA: RNA 2',3'-cyclic phosphodiesterase [Candidatus Limnocylindrales bacterium]